MQTPLETGSAFVPQPPSASAAAPTYVQVRVSFGALLTVVQLDVRAEGAELNARAEGAKPRSLAPQVPKLARWLL